MNESLKARVALFYCRNVPGSSEGERQALEKEYGANVRFFPLPCSGRLEPVHLLRALEEFADAVFLITCPEGACRYFEGNRRAVKRVERTKAVIADIGLKAERVGIIVGNKEKIKTLSEHLHELMETASRLGVSPVFNRSGEDRG